MSDVIKRIEDLEKQVKLLTEFAANVGKKILFEELQRNKGNPQFHEKVVNALQEALNENLKETKQ